MPAPQSTKFIGTIHVAHIESWNAVVGNHVFSFPSVDEDFVIPQDSKIKYCCWQVERGEEGTVHAQVYVQLFNRCSVVGMTKILPGHWEIQRGSNEDGRNYCRKEDTRVRGPWEFGVFVAGQGSRHDIECMKEAIKSGVDLATIRDLYPVEYSKYRNWVLEFYADCQQSKAPKVTEFRGVNGQVKSFHKWIISVCRDHDPDPRKIFWVYDPVGGTGKSYLAAYLNDSFGAYVVTGGKGADVFHSFAKQPSRVVVIDVPRTGDVGDFCMLENFKNGRAFSSKYDSRVLRFAKPHVFVFANFQPDRSKFSADRLVLIDVFNGEWTVDSAQACLAVHLVDM